jgi:hypothetical protein
MPAVGRIEGNEGNRKDGEGFEFAVQGIPIPQLF